MPRKKGVQVGYITVFMNFIEGLGLTQLLNILDTRLDIYSCGRNSNFTLGHGDDKERKIPEAVDVFARMIHISIQEVLKYNMPLY